MANIDLVEIWAKAAELKNAEHVCDIDPHGVKLNTLLTALNSLEASGHSEAGELLIYLCSLDLNKYEKIGDISEFEKTRAYTIGIMQSFNLNAHVNNHNGIDVQEVARFFTYLTGLNLRNKDPDFANWLLGPAG